MSMTSFNVALLNFEGLRLILNVLLHLNIYFCSGPRVNTKKIADPKISR